LAVVGQYPIQVGHYPLEKGMKLAVQQKLDWLRVYRLGQEQIILRYSRQQAYEDHWGKL
jgi:hypothetical protein